MNVIVYKELSYKIIGLAMEVHRELGYGFLEKVYENALMILFEENKVKAEQQKLLKVIFRGRNVGEYIADIIVEDSVIIELKCTANISPVHKAQVSNYLKSTGLKLGIIINFGKEKLEFERVVL